MNLFFSNPHPMKLYFILQFLSHFNNLFNSPSPATVPSYPFPVILPLSPSSSTSDSNPIYEYTDAFFSLSGHMLSDFSSYSFLYGNQLK